MTAVVVALVATALAVAGLVAGWPWQAYGPVVLVLSAVSVGLTLRRERTSRRLR